ncbi:hypothetical protein PFISCL1PPCAC_3718, partial [Pristionchus fissidentatus]
GDGAVRIRHASWRETAFLGGGATALEGVTNADFLEISGKCDVGVQIKAFSATKFAVFMQALSQNIKSEQGIYLYHGKKRIAGCSTVGGNLSLAAVDSRLDPCPRNSKFYDDFSRFDGTDLVCAFTIRNFDDAFMLTLADTDYTALKFTRSSATHHYTAKTPGDSLWKSQLTFLKCDPDTIVVRKDRPFIGYKKVPMLLGRNSTAPMRLTPPYMYGQKMNRQK